MLHEFKIPELVSREFVPEKYLLLLSKMLKEYPHTFEHSYRVATLSLGITMMLVQDPNVVIRTYIAALLHDLGKMFVDPEILHAPRALTEEERLRVSMHSIYGANLLTDLDREIVEAVRLHHTSFADLKQPNIIASILHACDVYDALSHQRCYKEAYSDIECMHILLKGSGSEFDPTVLNQLCVYIVQNCKNTVLDSLELLL